MKDKGSALAPTISKCGWEKAMHCRADSHEFSLDEGDRVIESPTRSRKVGSQAGYAVRNPGLFSQRATEIFHGNVDTREMPRYC